MICAINDGRTAGIEKATSVPYLRFSILKVQFKRFGLDRMSSLALTDLQNSRNPYVDREIAVSRDTIANRDCLQYCCLQQVYPLSIAGRCHPSVSHWNVIGMS